MVAYATLVGRSYWDIEKRAANVFALADAIRGGARQAASQRARDAGVTLPPAFDAFFARVTHEAPKSRYPSAVSAVRALAEALGVQPLAAPEHPPSAAADVEAGASPVSAATLSAAGRSDAYGEVSVPTPRRGLARRPRLPWLAGGAVLLAIVAAGVLVPWSRGKAPAPAAAPPPAPAVATGAAPASVALPAAPAPVVTPPPAPREEKVGAAAAALPFPKADAPARRRLSGSARVARAKARAAAPEPTTDVGTSLYSRD
jgi:serine/threonine-protein kinase